MMGETDLSQMLQLMLLRSYGLMGLVSLEDITRCSGRSSAEAERAEVWEAGQSVVALVRKPWNQDRPPKNVLMPGLNIWVW